MKHLVLAALVATAALSLAPAAYACSHPWLAFNGAHWQDTCDNTGAISQSGGFNVDLGLQLGGRNHISDSVSGSGNLVATVQSGDGNQSGVHINGDGNIAVVVQTGSGGWSTIGMGGSNGTAVIKQAD